MQLLPAARIIDEAVQRGANMSNITVDIWRIYDAYFSLEQRERRSYFLFPASNNMKNETSSETMMIQRNETTTLDDGL